MEIYYQESQPRPMLNTIDVIVGRAHSPVLLLLLNSRLEMFIIPLGLCKETNEPYKANRKPRYRVPYSNGGSQPMEPL